MPVKATVDDIRNCLVFTDGMRQIKIERLDLIPGVDMVPVQVRMCNARLKLHKEMDETDLWTYDGYYPGRFFVVRTDQTVAVEWVNEIDGTLPVTVVRSGYVPLTIKSVWPENEPGAIDGGTVTNPNGSQTPSPCKHEADAEAIPAWTVVHLHGARVAPDSDGWTENAFLPRSIQNASQHSFYPPQPRSMMLWYHDHAYTITRLNVFAGLAGGWIIRCPEEQGMGLPTDDFEVPLIIQDRNFDTKDGVLTGRLLHKAETDSSKFVAGIPDTAEFFGPFTLLNGSLWPSRCVEAKPYRFRVLNGSNARTYQLFLIDDKGKIRNDLIRQIGTDAGFLGTAVSIDSLKYGTSWPNMTGKQKGLILSPAERADLIVDFQREPGRTFRWINIAAAAYDGIPAPINYDPLLDFSSQLGTLTLARVPFPEVMQFVVGTGPVEKQIDLSRLPKLEAWNRDRPDPKTYTHRWLALNERVPDTTKNHEDGFLFFNELIELEAGDTRVVDFTITLAEDQKTYRFHNRPVFFRSPINFYPVAEGPEVWHLVNFSADAHPIHLHLVDFQILSRYVYKADGVTDPAVVNIVDSTDPFTGLFPDPKRPTVRAIIPDPARPNDPAGPNDPTPGDGVDANERGWKDVVRVNPNEIATIGMVFKGFTGRFMYHCHILEHEDMDMMRPMVVVPSMVKGFVNDMMMMAGNEPDNNGMKGMPGM